MLHPDVLERRVFAGLRSLHDAEARLQQEYTTLQNAGPDKLQSFLSSLSGLKREAARVESLLDAIDPRGRWRNGRVVAQTGGHHESNGTAHHSLYSRSGAATHVAL
jgi:hypothetical protein